jgi:hypothetical protein
MRFFQRILPDWNEWTSKCDFWYVEMIFALRKRNRPVWQDTRERFAKTFQNELMQRRASIHCIATKRDEIVKKRNDESRAASKPKRNTQIK